MTETEKKISILAQKKDVKALQNYVESLTKDHLIDVVKSRIFNSSFTLFWDYLLQSFTDTAESHKKRISLILIVLNELEKSGSSSISSQLVTRICTELPKFKSEDLVQLSQYCLECIQKGNTKTNLNWKDLLPEVLNVLSERTCVEHNQTEISGLEYKTQLITSLCMLQWSPEILTSLTTMFINLSLSKDEHCQVVNKLGEYMEKLSCQELPSFVYQLLKFCRNQNSRSIFLRLQNYFSQRVYSKNISEESNSEKSSLDLIEDSANQDVIDVESTILYHIYHCTTYGYESISDYISSLKKLIKSPEFVLHPFQISVLMTISCVPTFQDSVLDLVRSCIAKFFHEDNRRSNSAWIRDMVPRNFKIDAVFAQVIDLSLPERNLVIEGFVNLAFVLLGIGAGLGRDTVAEKQWNLGTNILIKILKKERNIASCVVQKLSNGIVISKTAFQYIDCIQILSNKMALTMLENQSCVVELMERLTQVPYPTANALLDALLPLMKLSPTMRDHLIMVLKKALYSRKSDTRRVAVSGFLKLLKSLKISNLIALSQSSSSSSYSSGQSLMAQVSLSQTGQAKPSIISNEALCLELLGVLRRCLMQQSEVRMQLYRGLYDAICTNFELSVPTLDIISSHFNQFYVTDEEVLPPLNISKITVGKDANVVLQEPLAELIQVCGLVVAKLIEDEDPEPGALRLKETLDSLSSRMANCELIHFELDDGTDLFDVVPESQQKMIVLKEMMRVYEALIAFKINTWNSSSENAAQQIKALFQAYKRLLDFSKNICKSKKGDKKKKLDNSELSQKKNSPSKQRIFKMPDTCFNFETLKKVLSLLHKTELDWTTPAQANILKPKADFHRFVMQCTLQILQNTKSTKIEMQNRTKTFQNVTDVAQILYDRCISRLIDFADFDTFTAVLAAESFQNALNIICSQFEDKLKVFLSKIGGGSEKDDLSTLLTPLIETYQKLLENVDEDDENQDTDMKKGITLILPTLSLLISQLPEDDKTVSSQLLEWFKKYCTRKNVNKQISQQLFSLYFELHLKYKSSLNLLENFTKRLQQVVGIMDQTITEDVEVHGWDIITDLTSSNAIHSICLSLKSILEDIDFVIVRLGAEYLMIIYPGEEGTEKRREYLKSKERGVCCQICLVLSIVERLCTISVPLGPLTEGIIKVITLLFNSLNCLTRYFITRSSKVNVAFQSARFERVVKLAGKNFFNKVYEFVVYIENNQKQVDNTQAKKQKQDSNVLKNKVLKETKLIPKLIYEMEQFGKSVIQLSNKTKVDLSKFLGQGAARDFRIKGLKEILKEDESDLDVSVQADEQSQHDNSDENMDHSSSKDGSEGATSDSENMPPPKRPRK